MDSITSAEPRPTIVPGETLVAEPTMTNRFLLWIDAVGGYLVCMNPVVRIGQMTPTAAVDVPLVADVARHHASLRRDGESYLVEPVHQVRLNGKPIDRTSLVGNGSLIELGQGVQFRFCQPNPLSSTARLDLVSRHRTHPTTHGIVLMADTCVLGPASNSHVVCRGWSKSMVLHRLQDSLYCVMEGAFTIDGLVCQRRGLAKPGSHIVGDDFSFSLEAA